MTTGEALERWLKHRGTLAELGSIAASTYVHNAAIMRIARVHLGARPLSDLRKSDLELFVAIRRRTCAPLRVREELSVLGQFLTWCVDEHLIDRPPRLPTVRVPPRDDPLPEDADYRWLLVNLPERHSEALEFMMLMGLSPHELERLETQDNRYDPSSPQAHTPPPFPVGIHIGGRPDFRVKQEVRRRWLALEGRALLLWVKHTFGTPATHRPFPTRDALEKAIQRLREARPDMPAGARRITPKLMRTWFGSKVAADNPEAVLRQLLGHAPNSPVTKKHYVRSTMEERRQALGGLKI